MFRDTETTHNPSSNFKPDECVELPSRDAYALSDSVAPVVLAQAASLLGAVLSLAVVYSDTGEPSELFRQVRVNHEPIRVLSVIERGDQVIVEYIDEDSGTATVRSLPKEQCVLMPVPQGTELDMSEFERHRTTQGNVVIPSKTEKLPNNLFFLKYPRDY
jgi:hypothetical protein